MHSDAVTISDCVAVKLYQTSGARPFTQLHGSAEGVAVLVSPVYGPPPTVIGSAVMHSSCAVREAPVASTREKANVVASLLVIP